MDPQQAIDVVRWRKAERERLRAERTALSVAERERAAEALARHLDALLAERAPIAGRVISGYWPIKAEPDLRAWLAAQHARGATTALPVVEVKAAPLVFRAWAPRMKMVLGGLEHPRAAARGGARGADHFPGAAGRPGRRGLPA